ncbi:hypothetical protein F5Y14DRAFT_444367 [Nemania sp. NC0429]|nr:hypothetical protein F5Y14DRAFT_444367 [Nemania sp. NC0429]
MGPTLSRLWKGHHPLPAGPLSNAPVDVFLLISDQLSGDALAALSLTCKSFYILLKARLQLLGADREALLLLLEKDLGDKLYYCPFCSRLHPFSPSWTPLDFDLRRRKIQSCCYEGCPVRGEAFRLGNLCRYTLGYHHARLVMNRHLFGAPNGLPLENLHRHIVEYRCRGGRPWTQNLSAKIVDNELFLQATHSFYGPDSIAYGGTPGHQRHFICPHIMTSIPPGYDWDVFDTISELKDHGLHRLMPCQDVLHHCSRCLTDFQITIERVKICERSLRAASMASQRGWVDDGTPIYDWYEVVEAGWQITIVAYHQFGSCRSPLDWKWKALSLPVWGRDLGARNLVSYPPGAVRQKCQPAVEAKIIIPFINE